jgi:hypothetical protein
MFKLRKSRKQLIPDRPVVDQPVINAVVLEPQFGNILIRDRERARKQQQLVSKLRYKRGIKKAVRAMNANFRATLSTSVFLASSMTQWNTMVSIRVRMHAA